VTIHFIDDREPLYIDTDKIEKWYIEEPFVAILCKEGYPDYHLNIAQILWIQK
jgi:hypothetical protein